MTSEPERTEHAGSTETNTLSSRTASPSTLRTTRMNSTRSCSLRSRRESKSSASPRPRKVPLPREASVTQESRPLPEQTETISRQSAALTLMPALPALRRALTLSGRYHTATRLLELERTHRLPPPLERLIVLLRPLSVVLLLAQLPSLLSQSQLLPPRRQLLTPTRREPCQNEKGDLKKSKLHLFKT